MSSGAGRNALRPLLRSALIVALLLALQPPARTAAQPAAPRTRIAVMLELGAAPATQVYAALLTGDQPATRAAATRATQAHLTRVDAEQRALLPRLAALDASVLYRTQRVYNGIATLVDATRVAELAQLPGVTALHPIVAKTVATEQSMPHVGAPLLWQGAAAWPAVQGEGIRIGIIDTGIDYLHTDFGGPGAGYGANNPQVIGDVAAFPGVKVAGGYDFVGDRYNADPASGSYQPLPEPDPDPYDCYGHGSHVAGIAAGFGVTTSGGTYTGAYDIDLNPADFLIGPGAAPRAQLFALKVFGCAGSSDIVDLAIEWAVDPNGDGDFSDRMDVINLSLGSPYGDAYDTSAVAANNAAVAGVIVVASAGNSRDNYFIVGAPSTGDHVISVAASQGGFSTHAADNAVLPAGDTVASFSSRGPRRGDAAIKPEIAAPGLAIVSAAAGTGYAPRTISGTSMAAPHVAGALALLRQLHPGWRPEEIKALAMNTSSTLVTLGSGQDAPFYAPGRIGAGRLDLTMAGAATVVAFNADRPGLVGLSFGAPQVIDQHVDALNVRMVNKATADVSYIASYVPVTDMPGVEVEPPATPIVVAAQGTAAFPLLLRADAATMRDRLDPTVAVIQTGARAWLSEESGHLLLWPQDAHLHATLVDADGTTAGAAGFAFTPATRTLHYTITLPAQQAMTPLTTTRTVSGEMVLSDQETLQLAAQLLAVTLYPDGAEGAALHGRIMSATPVLHLPVYAAPRAVANLQAAGEMVFPADVAIPASLSLAGSVPVTAPVSLSTLTYESPNTRPGAVAPGEVDRFDHADLRYVGVASDLAAGAESTDATIYFALATYAPWSTPNEVIFHVQIDADKDGVFERLLYNSNSERFATVRSDNDVYVAVILGPQGGRKAITGPLNGVEITTENTWPLLNSTMVLGVKASDLGLSAEQSDFDFKIATYSVDLFQRMEMEVEETPTLHFDLESQPFDFNDGRPGALLRSLAGAGPFTVEGRLNLPAFLAAGQPRLLLLHHRGAYTNQAETPATSYAWPYHFHLPWVAR